MARKARVKSESGMYHVVLLGNDKLLFAEDDDYRYFLLCLQTCTERDLAEVYAYCLFSEQVHLVIKEGLRPIGESIKALVSAYAVRCNEKYGRKGKLFYDRYLSEPIETDEELMDAVRFTVRLPLRQGGTLGYTYSSYNNYIQKKGLRSETLLFLCDDSTMRFREEMEREPARPFITGERKVTLTDAQVAERLRRMAAHLTSEEIERLTLPMLGEFVYRLQRDGASIRQLSRLLQLSKGRVEKALQVYKNRDEL